jgi:pimeloyl-ACP methyl ester carboxylesterase
MKLHFEIAGDGVPVVLTTGMGNSSAVWSKIAAPFAGKARTLVWDFRGHGSSEKSDDPEDYSAGHGIGDLVQMIANAGGSRDNPAILIGHSLGGYLSLQVAQQHPELVKALVLIATGPGFRNDAAREKWNEFARTIKLDADTDPAARLLALQSDDTVIKNLERVTVPTLVIVGEKDVGFHGAKDYFLSKLPDATAVVMSGAGHSVHKSHSAEVNEAIMTFIEKNRLI